MMHDVRFNRRTLLGKTARLTGSLPVISSIIATCISDDDERAPTIPPVIDTVTPAPTASPEPSVTATATLTVVPTATTSAVPALTATAMSVPTPAPTLVPADPELLEGLRDLAIPFDTAEPESGFGDLEPLREIVGDARIVALGEATHGTSEFFKMKHRLTEFLVTQLGFTIFAIEAPWPATKVINDYVHGADLSRSEILDGLTFWTWQTEEVLDLIEWMRDYNMRPGVTPVSFQAFDMQVDRKLAVNQVLVFVEEVEPQATERFEAYYAAVGTGGAQDALDDLLAHRNQYTDVPSTEPYEDIVQTARMIVQAQAWAEVGQSSDPETRMQRFEMRDRYMAENVTWLLDRAGVDAKIVLWAHNGHAATAEIGSTGGTTVRTMGAHLRKQYGNDLISVGFDLFSGSFTAMGRNSGGAPSAEVQWIHEIPLPPPDNVEHTFAQLDLPRFMLDLNTAKVASPAGAWLIEEHPMWSIGATFDPEMPENFRVVVNLPDEFDILIYFHETSASQRLF